MPLDVHLGLSCVVVCNWRNVCLSAASAGDMHRSYRMPSTANHNKMAWARDALARAKLTQRDLARVWSTAESSVSRWLDGFQGDLSVARAMQFANLVKMPCCEMMTLLGHPPDVVSEEQRPVTAQNTPPIPTVHMSPARNGKRQLLLHLELTAAGVAKIVAGLEDAAAERRAPASPPPLKRLEPSPSALNATPLRPGVGR
jgi:hypothetical protein